jgi:hypothetical protein
MVRSLATKKIIFSLNPQDSESSEATLRRPGGGHTEMEKHWQETTDKSHDFGNKTHNYNVDMSS